MSGDNKNDSNYREQYERVFNYFDENGDGKISASELKQCIGLIGGDLSLEEAEEAVAAMDSDGDGLLGLDDFIRLVDEGGVGDGGEEERAKGLREAFKMYEVEDGSGCITPKSLKRVLSRLGQSRTLQDCHSMISHFDLDGDGVLDFDEFMVMMTS